MITECFGDFSPYKKFYITDTSDLNQIQKCVHGSKAINTVTMDLWILQVDDKWQKFGTLESVNASWI